jgi:hypothetical protein
MSILIAVISLPNFYLDKQVIPKYYKDTYLKYLSSTILVRTLEALLYYNIKTIFIFIYIKLIILKMLLIIIL